MLCIVSNPPSTQPPPTTTTLRRTATSADAYSNSILNGIVGEGPTNSVIVSGKSEFLINALDIANQLTVLVFQLSVLAIIKHVSNLNEIDKSKQKLTSNSPRGYDWSKGNISKGHGAIASSHSPVICWLLPILSLLATFSCG